MRKGVKITLIIGLVIVTLVTGCVGAIFYGTSGLPAAAEEFFTLLKNENTEQAYNQTSQEFQATTTLSDFEEFVKDSLFDKYEDATWSRREINLTGARQIGVLEGAIETSTNAVIPLHIELIKENDKWRIRIITIKSAGIRSQGEKERIDIPDDATLQNLAYETLQIFSDNLRMDDFTPFHNYISAVWRIEITEEELREVFQGMRPFLDTIQTIAETSAQSVILTTTPSLDENNVLSIKGYIPLEGKALFFELNYLYERPEWKLVSINVKI